MGKFPLIAIGVVGLLLGLPFAGGCQAEKSFRALPDTLSQATSGRMDVEVLSYERGWFRSQAQTRVGVAGASPETGLVMNHSITHGPFPVGELLEGRIPRSLSAAVVHTEWLPDHAGTGGDDTPFFTMRTEVGFGENADVMFEIPATDNPAEGFEWRGLKGSLTAQGDGKQRMEFESPGFQVHGPQGSVSVGTLRGEFALGASPNRLPVGSGTISVDQVDLTQGGSPQGAFGLRQVQWSYKEVEGLPGETVNVRNNLTVAEFVGGARKIRDANLQIDVQDLDVQAMRMLEALPPGNAASTGFQPTPEHEDVLRLFLARSPELEASLRMTTSGGILEGFVLVRPPQNFPSGYAHALLRASNVRGRFLLPVSSIKLEVARKMEAAGLLVRQDEHYLMRLIYRNGMLDVNGWLRQPNEVVPMAMLVFRSIKL